MKFHDNTNKNDSRFSSVKPGDIDKINITHNVMNTDPDKFASVSNDRKKKTFSDRFKGNKSI